MITLIKFGAIMSTKSKIIICAVLATIFFMGASYKLYSSPILQEKISERFTKTVFVDVPVPAKKQELSKEIHKQAVAQNLPYVLITAVIGKESVFNPFVNTSIPGGKQGDTAKGLMQLYQAEGIEIDPNRAFDLSYNIDTGCQIIKKKMELNNNRLEKALANYSGNADGYPSSVLENVGRIVMFQTMLGGTK
jgi:hypothetical protein